MRRLLVIGHEISNFASSPWASWLSANPLDYQGLLLDCRNPSGLPPPSVAVPVFQKYLAGGHSIYLVLPQASALTSNLTLAIIPANQFQVERASGLTVSIKSSEPFFKQYGKALDGHEICFHRSQLPGYAVTPWEDAIVDNIGRSICGRTSGVFVLHPPARKKEQQAFKTIIEHFRPDLPVTSTLPRPAWLETLAEGLPGVSEIRAKRQAVEGEIEKLTTERNIQDAKLLDLTSWTDMLWADGLALQTKVCESLNLLGIPAKSPDPTAHEADLSAEISNIQTLFEVTGSSGSIGIEKGRQLLHWVLESKSPASTKGVLIANAFRNNPPEKRPPTADHRIFVAEVEELAQRFHLALLDVRELFRMVVLKLEGREVDSSLIAEGLQRDGIVRFRIE